MFDMTKFIKKHFEIKISEGNNLFLLPPKMKVLKKIVSLSGNISNEQLEEKDIDNLVEAIALAISKNKQEIKISAEQVEDMFDLEDMIIFLKEYFNWVSEITNQKNF